MVSKSTAARVQQVLIQVGIVDDGPIRYRPLNYLTFYDFKLRGVTPDAEHHVHLRTLTETGELESLRVLVLRHTGRWTWRTVTLAQLEKMVAAHVSFVNATKQAAA